MTGAGRAAGEIGKTVSEVAQTMTKSGQPQNSEQANSSASPTSVGRGTGAGAPSSGAFQPQSPPGKEPQPPPPSGTGSGAAASGRSSASQSAATPKEIQALARDLSPDAKRVLATAYQSFMRGEMDERPFFDIVKSVFAGHYLAGFQEKNTRVPDELIEKAKARTAEFVDFAKAERAKKLAASDPGSSHAPPLQGDFASSGGPGDAGPPSGAPSAEVPPPGNVGAGAPLRQPTAPSSPSSQPQAGVSPSSPSSASESDQGILDAPDVPESVRRLMKQKGKPSKLASIFLNEPYRGFREGSLKEPGFRRDVHSFFASYYLKDNPKATEADRAQVQQAADDLVEYAKRKLQASPPPPSEANSGRSSSGTSSGAPPSSHAAPSSASASTSSASPSAVRPASEPARGQDNSSSPKHQSAAVPSEPPIRVLDGPLKERAEALEGRKRSGKLTEPEFRAQLFNLIGRQPIVVEIAPGVRYDFRETQAAPGSQLSGSGQSQSLSDAEKSGAQQTTSHGGHRIQPTAASKLTNRSEVLVAAEKEIQSVKNEVGLDEMRARASGSPSPDRARLERKLDLGTGIQILHDRRLITDEQYRYAMYEVLTEGGKQLGIFELNWRTYDFSDQSKIPLKPAGWDG